jgi:hypothetical protein
MAAAVLPVDAANQRSTLSVSRRKAEETSA